jgi:hypothetical protein
MGNGAGGRQVSVSALADQIPGKITFADGSVRDYARDVRPDRFWRYLLDHASLRLSEAGWTGRSRALALVSSRAVVTRDMALDALTEAVGYIAVGGGESPLIDYFRETLDRLCELTP